MVGHFSRTRNITLPTLSKFPRNASPDAIFLGECGRAEILRGLRLAREFRVIRGYLRGVTPDELLQKPPFRGVPASA